MHHLDVIRNDWESSKQTLVGRVTVQGDDIQFDETDAVKLRSNIDAIAQETRAIVDPDERLRIIARALTGPVVSVVGPHEDDECPFIFGHTIEMEWGEVNDIDDLLGGHAASAAEPLPCLVNLNCAQVGDGPGPRRVPGRKERLHHVN